jgi:hypothetical protein
MKINAAKVKMISAAGPIGRSTYAVPKAAYAIVAVGANEQNALR